MLPTLDSGEDADRIGLPEEGLRLFVVFVEKAVKVRDRAKDATRQTTFGECGEESCDGVSLPAMVVLVADLSNDPAIPCISSTPIFWVIV